MVTSQPACPQKKKKNDSLPSPNFNFFFGELTRCVDAVVEFGIVDLSGEQRPSSWVEMSATQLMDDPGKVLGEVVVNGRGVILTDPDEGKPCALLLPPAQEQ